jgi:CheY-like chemotaxis protein
MTADGTDCPTILVVDDFDDTRVMLRRALEMRNYRVLEAANGAQAVEIARRACPDLILMDLNMPEVDGLMAAQRIRECRDACRDARIIALTAFHTFGMKEAALAAGCDGYILKPIDLDELDKVMQQFLSA